LHDTRKEPTMTTDRNIAPTKKNLSRPAYTPLTSPISAADAEQEPPAERTFAEPAKSYATRAVTIHLLYHGVPVDLWRADLGIETIEQLVDQITGRDGWAAAGDKSFPTLPDGTPICPRHGVPMKLREKQGDQWWSHNVARDGEEPCYCRGYPGKNSPGWDR
jgi:hypothetical protein